MKVSQRIVGNIDITLPDYHSGVHASQLAEFQEHLQEEIATKWLCNCLTTGSYSSSGKVFHNYMVDVRVR